MLHLGVQELVVAESRSAAGVTTREVVVQSDTILLTLWCSSIAVGSNLTVKAYSFTDDARLRKVELFSFPVLSAATTFLLQERAAITTARVLIEVTYTGAVEYEIYARAIGAGLSETKILGSTSLRMSQKDVGSGAPVVLLAASLQDRAGILVKNWSDTGTVYLGGTTGEATTAAGYPLAPKDALAVDLAAGQAVYAIASTGTVDVRIVEAGG